MAALCSATWPACHSNSGIVTCFIAWFAYALPCLCAQAGGRFVSCNVAGMSQGPTTTEPCHCLSCLTKPVLLPLLTLRGVVPSSCPAVAPRLAATTWPACHRDPQRIFCLTVSSESLKALLSPVLTPRGALPCLCAQAGGPFVSYNTGTMSQKFRDSQLLCCLICLSSAPPLHPGWRPLPVLQYGQHVREATHLPHCFI